MPYYNTKIYYFLIFNFMGNTVQSKSINTLLPFLFHRFETGREGNLHFK